MTHQTTITPDPDGNGVILHLPEITHLDTQVWSADVGLTAEGLAALRTALAAVSAAVAPPTNRAAVLREAADRIDNEELPHDYVDMFDNGARWAARLLRRMADETATETPAPDDRRLHACTQFGTWFDRSVCAEPCGAMHTRCTNCGVALDACPHQPAAGARQDEPTVTAPSRQTDETPDDGPACAHCGGNHAWDNCEAYTKLVAAEGPDAGARP